MTRLAPLSRYYFLFGLLLISLPVWGGPTPRAKEIRIQRFLVAERRDTNSDGIETRQYQFRWVEKGHPIGLNPRRLVHEKGRVKVMRQYTPRKKTTLVEQITSVSSIKQPTNEAEAAAYSKFILPGLIQARSINPPDQMTLDRAAMAGMLNVMDRHTMYYSPTQFDTLKSNTQGTFVGVGIDVNTKGTPEIRRCYRGSAAQKAGLRQGDIIVAVNNQPVSSLDQATPLLLGEAGSAVSIQVNRGGKQLTVNATRAVTEHHPIGKRLTPDRIGYVKLAEFTRNSAEKVLEAVETLNSRSQREHQGPLRGLVIDLRNNGGGLLDEVIPLANGFIPQGTLFSTRNRTREEVYKACPLLVRHPDLPLVVLVNGRTASASELLTGSLRDAGRALIIGKKTFGKGTMQTNIDLPDGSGLKLTTDRYYLPGGTTPDQVGIAPQITSDQAKASYLQKHPGQNKPRIVDYDFEAALAHLRQQ